MNTSKNKYITPGILKINLDSEISLILTSNQSPEGEPDDWSKAPDYFDPNAAVIS